jgi:hypothetical protein
MIDDKIDIHDGMFALGLVDVAISLENKGAQYLIFMPEHYGPLSVWYRFRNRKPYRLFVEVD